jgi:hypothetical protein
MFTAYQNRKLMIRYSGDKAYKPKNIELDELYPVIAVKHSERRETLIENKKKRESVRHDLVFFAIGDNMKVVSIPDYNCNVFIEGIDVAAKKKD